MAIEDGIIIQLIEMLDTNNHLAKIFRHARDLVKKLWSNRIWYHAVIIPQYIRNF